MKKILAMVLSLTLCLSGCTIFQQLLEEADKAVVVAEEFCFALANDDMDNAKSFLHPNWETKKGSFEKYLLDFESKNGIDFSDGVAIKSRFDKAATAYDSNYDGSIFKIGISIFVGNKELKLYFIIVDNTSGYGIYDFGLYSDRPD